MKKVLFSAALLTTALAAAQNTGIGTTKPEASAKLEVASSNQGVLMPRLALSSTTVAAPVVAPVNGLTVFNTATAGDVTPGYYYWNANKWVKIIDANSQVIPTEPLQVMV